MNEMPADDATVASKGLPEAEASKRAPALMDLIESQWDALSGGRSGV